MKNSRLIFALLVICLMVLASCVTYIMTKNYLDASNASVKAVPSQTAAADPNKSAEPTTDKDKKGTKAPTRPTGRIRGTNQNPPVPASPSAPGKPTATGTTQTPTAPTTPQAGGNPWLQRLISGGTLLWAAAGLLILSILLLLGFLIAKTSGSKTPESATVWKGRKNFGKIIPGNAQNIGSREQQQDAFGFSDLQNAQLIEENGALVLLADGMGGMEMGREASNLAVRTALAGYRFQPGEETIPSVLRRIMLTANEAVYEMAHQKGKVGGIGTTMMMAVIHQGQLYWASAGDSRIYLYRGGQMAQLTTDHVYSRDLAKMVQSHQISQEEADRHPERNALTSYLGLANLPEIDQNVNPLALQPGDKVVLCSDGLYNVLPLEEMAETLSADAPMAAEALIQRTLAKEFYGQDNVTVAILQYE